MMKKKVCASIVYNISHIHGTMFGPTESGYVHF